MKLQGGVMLASGCRGLRLAPRHLPAAMKAPHICILPPVVRGEDMTYQKWMSSHSATTSQTASDAKVNMNFKPQINLETEKGVTCA